VPLGQNESSRETIHMRTYENVFRTLIHFYQIKLIFIGEVLPEAQGNSEIANCDLACWLHNVCLKMKSTLLSLKDVRAHCYCASLLRI